MIIDISPIISAAIDVWPGDTKFSLQPVCEMASGNNYTVNKIESTLHLGAHADAPQHFIEDGVDISQVALEKYIGKVQVIEVSIAKSQRIDINMLSEEIMAPRVLLKTNTFPDPNNWNNDFAALSVELIQYLASKGVVLVGIDTPSVDLFASKSLPAHHALLANGMAHLEGLLLTKVNPGLYKLIALPLNIQGADASPVRAVLVDDATLASL